MRVQAAASPDRGQRLRRAAVALGLLAAVVAWADPARIGSVLLQADPGWLLAGLLCSALANAASAWRWRDLAAWLGHAVPLRWAVATYFRGVAANVVLPGAVVGGDVLRAWGLHRHGMPVLEAGVSVVLDRLSGLWGLLILGALALGAGMWGAAVGGWRSIVDGLGWVSAGTVTALAVLAAAAMVALPCGALYATPWLERQWAALRRPALRWWHHLAHHNPGRHCFLQIGGSLLVQAASVTTLYCAAQAIGAPLPWGSLAVAAVPIFVFATLPVGFGGWGTREAAAMVALGPLGLDTAAAVAVSVLYGLYPVAQSVFALVPTAARQPDAPGGGA
ncbi:MAG: lysylphosphatidylglycerol synthase transmembrane domain-containing protein [Tepidimonas sp.]|uniref:lysylphosphatidylglycerol synthase transmembrane domain-containing protein n=1 Tax=Tepidimonas sp. TaxID=2002775 RepID=UPI004054BB1E